MAMHVSERGAYITLLCLCWMEGSLPVDLGELARMCKLSTAAFTRLWPALEPCFTIVDGRLLQGRIEKERRKQEAYRELKAQAGRQGGRPKADGKQTLSRTKANESSPSPSPSPSSFPIVVPSELRRRGGGQAPLWRYPRFAVFRWMVDELQVLIGPDLEHFKLDLWFDVLSQRAEAERVVIPDPWAFIKAETLAEAGRRGLAIAVVETPGRADSLSTRMTAMVARSRAEGE